MKFLKIITLLLFAVSLNASDIAPDAAMSGMQFLEEPTSPEIIGMGYAGSASMGMGGFFYNPAKYSFVKQSSFHLEFGRYKGWDANKVNFEMLIPVKRAFIAYGMRFFSIDGIQEVDAFGNLPYGSFSDRGLKISLGSGFELNKYLNFGFSLSGVIHDMYVEEAFGLLIGAGLIGSPIPGKLNIGLSIVDFGFSTGMSEKVERFEDGERLPVNSRLGIVWMDTLKSIDYRVLFDIVYRNIWDTTDDFTNRISDRFSFPVGLEIRPVAPLALRLGKRINFPTEILNMGMGLKTSQLDFDFGLVINSLSGDGEVDWTGSFTYRLVKKSRVESETEKLKRLKAPKDEKIENDKVKSDNLPKEKIVKDTEEIKIIEDEFIPINIDTVNKEDSIVALDTLQDEFSDDTTSTVNDSIDVIEESDSKENQSQKDSLNIDISTENVILNNTESINDSLVVDEDNVLEVDSAKVEKDEIFQEEVNEISAPGDSTEN